MKEICVDYLKKSSNSKFGAKVVVNSKAARQKCFFKNPPQFSALPLQFVLYSKIYIDIDTCKKNGKPCLSEEVVGDQTVHSLNKWINNQTLPMKKGYKHLIFLIQLIKSNLYRLLSLQGTLPNLT